MARTNPMPNGEVQGDTRAMPDRGTSTGVSDTYGTNLNGTATNRHAAKSDSPFDGDPDNGRMDGDE